MRAPSLLLLFLTIVGCFRSHEVGPRDAAVDAPTVRIDASPDVGAEDAAICELSTVRCAALPGCLGASPPETLHCDEVRICVESDVAVEAIRAVTSRIRCLRAESCDYLCAVAVGSFDDDVVEEICAITSVAPAVEIECSVFGP